MSDQTVTERFNEVYNATYKAVMAYIAGKCGNTADMGDIAQEVYIEVYEMLCKRGVGYPRSDKAVVMKIAQQKIARHYSRMDRLRMLVPLRGENEDGDDDALTPQEVDAFMTEDYVIDQMMHDSARQIIRQKPEDVKKVFYLFYDLGLTIAETAQALGVSESNVKNKLYRTLKELRSLLE
jgi:RNA polymerase sigma-70 factor (ECF subfamily)